MAKLSFSKLGLTKNNNIKNIEYNGQNIEIKQYLPVNEKAILVATILNYITNNQENRFPNPMQIEVFTVLGIIEKYTNISFTDKQKEDSAKLYDLITSSGLWDLISNNLNMDDYTLLLNFINKTIESYYNYINSVFGILDDLQKDYEKINFDATEIQKKLGDPEQLQLLKDIMTKLG